MIEWLQDAFAWMYWTWPSVIVLGLLAGAIAGLTVWDMVSPGVRRKGFLPIPTTRGDRLFLGVMGSIGLFLIWVAWVGNGLLGVALGVVVVWNVVIGRWG